MKWTHGLFRRKSQQRLKERQQWRCSCASREATTNGAGWGRKEAAACAGEPCSAVAGELQTVFATGAFETAVGGRHRRDQRLHRGARSCVEDRSNEPLAGVASGRAAGSAGGRSDEQPAADRGNRKRTEIGRA